MRYLCTYYTDVERIPSQVSTTSYLNQQAEKIPIQLLGRAPQNKSDC